MILTALAEAEVEYEDHTSPSIWVKFGVAGEAPGSCEKIGTDVRAVILDDNPWTIFSFFHLTNWDWAFHPDFNMVGSIQNEEHSCSRPTAVDCFAGRAGSGSSCPREIHKKKGSEFGDEVQHPLLPIQVLASW